MRPICNTLALAAVVAGCATAPRPAEAPFFIEGQAAAAEREQVAGMSAHGREQVEDFFDLPFKAPLRVIAAGSRAEFDTAFPAAWGIAPTQCWMVGVGVADFLAVLVPSAWADEACDHAPGDLSEAQQIITHELTHSLHAQYNPTGDFTGMDDMGWFVEGLAVLVSGQMERPRMASAADAIAANAAPATLAEAWSGRYRYGVCGSLVQFIDETYGRDTLKALLAATTNAQVLERLGISEPELLERWREWALARAT